MLITHKNTHRRYWVIYSGGASGGEGGASIPSYTFSPPCPFRSPSPLLSSFIFTTDKNNHILYLHLVYTTQVNSAFRAS